MKLRIAAALLFSFVTLIGVAEAEVSVHGRGGFIVIVLEDSPDPLPWFVITGGRLDLFFALNPFGDENGDGPPNFSIDRNSTPHVTWAWWDGHDHEIVVSRWTGAEWSVPEQVTTNEIEDLDPQIYVDALGARHLTWWRPGGDDQVWYRIDGAGDGPEVELVSQASEDGTRPSVVYAAGVPMTAYQRHLADAREVVVARRDGSAWATQSIAVTSYVGPAADGDIDVQVHSAGGRVWVDWVDGAGRLGFSTRDGLTGAWSAPEFRFYSWNTAAGVSEVTAREFARIDIRHEVLR